jgi:hypothetical protein
MALKLGTAAAMTIERVIDRGIVKKNKKNFWGPCSELEQGFVLMKSINTNCNRMAASLGSHFYLEQVSGGYIACVALVYCKSFYANKTTLKRLDCFQVLKK